MFGAHLHTPLITCHKWTFPLGFGGSYRWAIKALAYRYLVSQCPYFAFEPNLQGIRDRCDTSTCYFRPWLECELHNDIVRIIVSNWHVKHRDIPTFEI